MASFSNGSNDWRISTLEQRTALDSALVGVAGPPRRAAGMLRPVPRSVSMSDKFSVQAHFSGTFFLCRQFADKSLD